VVAADGYPTSPRAGDEVTGLAAAAEAPGATVLHAGTALDGAGRVVSSGGRVLSVVGTGPDLAAARASAYDAVDRIVLPGGHHRTDIAAVAAANTPATT
jgi:phosphoribosylamine--glycine ligase